MIVQDQSNNLYMSTVKLMTVIQDMPAGTNL